MVVANNLPDVANGNVIIGARLLNRRSPQGQRLIASTNYLDGRLCGLPEGWLVENRPRTRKNSNRADNFYYEPGTHKQFRSMEAVKRHLRLIATEQGNKRQPGTWRCSKVTNSKPKKKRKNGSSFNHANIAKDNLLTLANAIRD